MQRGRLFVGVLVKSKLIGESKPIHKRSLPSLQQDIPAVLVLGETD